MLVITGLVKHLVTLIKHKVLDLAQLEVTRLNKSVDATGSSNHNVRGSSGHLLLINLHTHKRREETK